ncbi:hypothetical protein CPHO_09835 [Corynebacterium phocae]|uniref:HTH cro/C1-type domain-containing protein n=1 Tax=Corynebacterium phocae TaxID=161895 RepID=A0A1L7D4U4_9CORY|nr:helix-turn-helix transcriptional regulator [Corynebacterium phocae]APT93140.1 hypothetical protein CPHO_09835 [Corynebacterium phocae]KAA8722216.1 helix-turn-helix transcriptional regulator [Corynebacterium phocae]
MAFAIHSLVWLRYGHNFSENLRELRRRRGLSVVALAELAGLSRNQVYNLERRHPHCADPLLSTVFKLALALEVPPAVLMPGAAQLVDGQGHLKEPDWSVLVAPHQVAKFPDSYVANRRSLARKDAF